MLTIEQAKQELVLAAENSPGLWEPHCQVAAENAKRIAQKAPGLYPGADGLYSGIFG